MYAKILLMTAVLLSGQVYAQTTPEKKQPASTVQKKKKKIIQPTTSAIEAAGPQEVIIEEIKAGPNKEAAPITVTPPSTTAQKVLKYLKEKFAVSYHGEYYFTRKDVDSANQDDHNIQDIKYMHNPTIIYKISPNWQLLGTAEFKHTDAVVGQGTFVNDYHRSLFTLTRKNILVESEKGIQLDAGIGRRDYNTRTTTSSFGNDRLFATFSKKYGKNSGSLFVQYILNDSKKAAATSFKHIIELIPTINLQLTDRLSYLFNDDINFNTAYTHNSYNALIMSHEINLAYLTFQWTEKFSTYYQYKYYHTEDFTNGLKDDFMEHYVGAGYVINPKVTVTGEVGSETFHARDGRKGFSKKTRFPELAIYLDISL